MPSNAEIAKDAIEQFKKIQRYMTVAKKGRCDGNIRGIKIRISFLKSIIKCHRRKFD